MRSHRFFIKNNIPEKGDFSFEDSALAHQLLRVLRLKPGMEMLLLDNSGSEFLVRILNLTSSVIEVSVLEKKKNRNIPKREVWLFLSLLKKDKFEWVLEKGVEVGVSHFMPVISERSEKKGFNLRRAEKILKEASEQSGRGVMPKLGDVQTFEEALESLFLDSDEAGVVAFHPAGQEFLLSDFENIKKIKLFVGPEGGYSPKETGRFEERGVPLRSLGKQTLRAETAGVVSSSLFLLDF